MAKFLVDYKNGIIHRVHQQMSSNHITAYATDTQTIVVHQKDVSFQETDDHDTAVEYLLRDMQDEINLLKEELQAKTDLFYFIKNKCKEDMFEMTEEDDDR